MPARVANVLEEDPALGESLEPERRGVASAHAGAAVIQLTRGVWEPEAWPRNIRDGLGLLVLDGLMLRRVDMEGRFGSELLGHGDLLQPWQREDAFASVPRQSGWRVLHHSRLAILDVAFAQRISNYPEIAGKLVGRALRRSRSLTVNMAIVHQPKVETRLHMLLWHLADRWGRTGSEGVMLPVTLTHEILAELVAARRPTVSAALGELQRQGSVERLARGWLLRGAPPGELVGVP